VKTALEKAREAPGSTKARILAAAEEAFAARGFEGASTREIAARAGVNISSLHYHWESKETLYVAVFRNVFDQIRGVLEDTLPPLLAEHREPQTVMSLAVGRIFDFFGDNPNLPRLLMRRIIENDAGDFSVERDVFAPAWAEFSAWLARLGPRKVTETEGRFFILTMYTVVMVYLLDSPAYQQLLGGSVRTGALATQLREHVISIVRQLLA
jgi:AcrR family transcriptional regulator